RSGDPHHAQVRVATAQGQAQAAQAQQRVRADDDRGPRGGYLSGRQHARGAGGRRGLGEVVPVCALARQGNEAVPGPDTPAVPREARHPGPGVAGDHPSAGEFGDLGGGKQMRQLDPPFPTRASINERATARSSKGTVRSLKIWYVSCPLPAMTTTSSGPAMVTARRMASVRSMATS